MKHPSYPPGEEPGALVKAPGVALALGWSQVPPQPVAAILQARVVLHPEPVPLPEDGALVEGEDTLEAGAVRGFRYGEEEAPEEDKNEPKGEGKPEEGEE